MSSKTLLRQEILLELNFLKSLGAKIFIYPFINKKRNQLICYKIIYTLVLCTAIQLFLTLCSNSSNDWLEIINVAPNLGVVIMAVIKYTKLHTYKEVYHKLYHHFRYDIWDIVSSNSPSHQKIIKRYKWIAKSINRFLFYYSIPLIVVVDSFPYLVMIYENKFNHVTDQYLYPFDGWYPFDRVKWYAAVYIWESCMTAIVVFVYVFSNMIHTSYIVFICMELRILGNCLKEIKNPEGAIQVIGRTKKEADKDVIRKLKVIISKHEYLAKTAAKLNLVLGDAMLLNYSLGSIFICLTAFTSTMVDNLYKSLRYFFMCISLLVEIFNQCVIGQILSDHSVELADTIYSWDWTSASPEAKKIILLFIMRTQKPFKLTGNGYITMNMDTFSRIMSSSYQFFNLLRTIYR